MQQFAPALSGLPPDPAPPLAMQKHSASWRPALLALRRRCSAGGTGSAGCAGPSRAHLITSAQPLDAIAPSIRTRRSGPETAKLFLLDRCKIVSFVPSLVN